MTLSADIKYGIHVLAFISWVVIFEILCGAIPIGVDTHPQVDPIKE